MFYSGQHWQIAILGDAEFLDQIASSSASEFPARSRRDPQMPLVTTAFDRL